jgi:hypothetical protein
MYRELDRHFGLAAVRSPGEEVSYVTSHAPATPLRLGFDRSRREEEEATHPAFAPTAHPSPVIPRPSPRTAA